MKKIFALFVLFLAFSVNASAQNELENIDRNAKKDLEAIISIVKVDNNMHMPLYNLFKKKHKDLASPSISDAQKNKISESIEAKLRASLTADQIIELEKKPAVFTQLISGKPSSEIKEKK